MVEVVLEEVVLGQVLEVGVLDEGQVCVCEEPDIHCGRVSLFRGKLEVREGEQVVERLSPMSGAVVSAQLRVDQSSVRMVMGVGVRDAELSEIHS